MDDTLHIPIRSLTYELMEAGALVCFAPEVLESGSLSVDQQPTFVRERIAVRFMTNVARWREERFLEVPANWWQHFKKRWFPAWALERWPVLTTTYDAAVILPKVPVVRREYMEPSFPVWLASQPMERR